MKTREDCARSPQSGSNYRMMRAAVAATANTPADQPGVKEMASRFIMRPTICLDLDMAWVGPTVSRSRRSGQSICQLEPGQNIDGLYARHSLSWFLLSGKDGVRAWVWSAGHCNRQDESTNGIASEPGDATLALGEFNRCPVSGQRLVSIIHASLSSCMESLSKNAHIAATSTPINYSRTLSEQRAAFAELSGGSAAITIDHNVHSSLLSV
jgi:hypothetical protein